MSGAHVPVLLAEVMQALRVREGGAYLDATFGRGGYARAILAAGAGSLVGLDRDPEAIATGQALAAREPRLRMVEAAFSTLDAHASVLAGVVFDFGVSSPQLDEAGRGFSFMADGPLDMRMGGQGPTAADALNHLPEAALAAIFAVYGEEREARRLARAVAADRTATPFTRTLQFAGLCERVVGRGARDASHPATRAFQALRIFVNDELHEIACGLAAAERALAPDGRLVVVTFHSLEDRIAKRFFAEAAGRTPAGSRHAPTPAGRAPATFHLEEKAAIGPSLAEVAANPRARSAKLRWGVRTAAPARSGRPARPAGVPTLDDLGRAA